MDAESVKKWLLKNKSYAASIVSELNLHSRSLNGSKNHLEIGKKDTSGDGNSGSFIRSNTSLDDEDNPFNPFAPYMSGKRFDETTKSDQNINLGDRKKISKESTLDIPNVTLSKHDAQTKQKVLFSNSHTQEPPASSKNYRGSDRQASTPPSSTSDVYFNISRAINHSLIIKNVMFNIKSSAEMLVDAEKSAVFILDADNQELYSVNVEDVKLNEEIETRDNLFSDEEDSTNTDKSGNSSESVRFPVGVGIVGHVARTQKGLCISDVQGDSRFSKISDFEV
jgi:hypothetical protein